MNIEDGLALQEEICTALTYRTDKIRQANKMVRTIRACIISAAKGHTGPRAVVALDTVRYGLTYGINSNGLGVARHTRLRTLTDMDRMEHIPFTAFREWEDSTQGVLSSFATLFATGAKLLRAIKRFDKSIMGQSSTTLLEEDARVFGLWFASSSTAVTIRVGNATHTPLHLSTVSHYGTTMLQGRVLATLVAANPRLLAAIRTILQRDKRRVDKYLSIIEKRQEQATQLLLLGVL